MANFLKTWVWNWKMVKEMRDNAIREGSKDAFKKAHADIIETMNDDVEKRANKLADNKLSTMLSPVNLAQIVSRDVKTGVVKIGGEVATNEQLLNLKSEAEFFTSSTLWSLLQETPKKLAQDTLFVSSESLVDLQKGKTMLYLLSQQKNIVDLFKEYVARE